MKIEGDAGALDGNFLVYDGDCPFCSAYVKVLRLREALGADLRLLSARDGGPVVDALVARGYNLDEHFVMVHRGHIYHGAECINRIALLTGESRLFNRINAAIFRSPVLSRVLYPWLRMGRNTTLFLLGRPQLEAIGGKRPKGGRRSVKITRAMPMLIAGMLAIFFVISNTHYLLPGGGSARGEIFPFFNWALFSRVNETRKGWDLDFRKPMAPAKSQVPEGSWVTGESLGVRHNISLSKNLARFARLHTLGDHSSEEYLGLRNGLDRAARTFGYQEYCLVREVFDPFDRYTQGVISERQCIDTFSAASRGA